MHFSSPGQNIISLILHLDGVSLTKSSKLKLWLFSGSFVEVPPKLRFRRYNMILLSIWIGCTEPPADLWLNGIIDSISRLKREGKSCQ